MLPREELTAVYFLCYHSQPGSLDGTKDQYRVVEQAIKDGEWPYDNGDDPSFYAARKHLAPLTWGVCRQDVRNTIPLDSVAVFFSFTAFSDDTVRYRLCAVTTVTDKVDTRAVWHDKRLAGFRNKYINNLIRRHTGGWRHDESDRPVAHENWLWRIADHSGMKKKEFDKRYVDIYDSHLIPDSVLDSGMVKLAKNYIILSTDLPDGYICPNPPEVAFARKGESENWLNKSLESLTVGTAGKYGGRHYLRIANKSNRNVHRQIVFEMPTNEMVIWRKKLIAALTLASKHRSKNVHAPRRASGRLRC